MATSAESNPFPTSASQGMSGSQPESVHTMGESSLGDQAADAASRLGDAAERAASSIPPAPELLDRLVKGAHTAIDKMAERATPHVQRLQEGMSGASDVLQTKAGVARDMSDEWAETLRVTVRDRPIAAVATALAVGLLVARLTR